MTNLIQMSWSHQSIQGTSMNQQVLGIILKTNLSTNTNTSNQAKLDQRKKAHIY